MRVYLSGKMAGRMGKEVIEERAYVTERLEACDIEVCDPALTEPIDPSKPIDLKLDYTTMKSFVAKDEFGIRTSNLMLVLTGDTPSDGTWWEMGLAHFEVGIPIVVVAPKRCKEGLMGFTNIKVDAMFETVDEAVAFIAANYCL